VADDRKRQRKRTEMDRVAKVQEILRRWDPIGIQPGEIAPADEYDSYAPHIVSMVAQDCSRDLLSAHLEALRKDIIGVEPDRKTDWEIADEIIKATRDKAV